MWYIHAAKHNGVLSIQYWGQQYGINMLLKTIVYYLYSTVGNSTDMLIKTMVYYLYSTVGNSTDMLLNTMMYYLYSDVDNSIVSTCC